MRLIIVSGLSGSGKSVALAMLEDLEFYCVDNIPAGLLPGFIAYTVRTSEPAYRRTAVGVDARNRPEDLADVPRHRDRQLAAGADVAEEDLRDGPGSGFARHPGVQDRGRPGGLVRDGQRPTRHEDEHDRRACGDNGVEELGLATGQPQLHAIASLSAGARRGEAGALPEDEDGHIGSPGSLDRGHDVDVIAFEDPAPARVADLCRR